jgi:hypothetical protein
MKGKTTKENRHGGQVTGLRDKGGTIFGFRTEREKVDYRGS